MMIRKLVNIFLLIPLYCTIAITPTSPSFAKEQNNTPKLDYRNNIPVISVRKIPERPEAVPFVAHLLDQDTIKQANIHSPTDISSLTPGFSFNDPFGRYNPAPSFRGLIQPGLGDDPSVGFFNDGIYLSGRSSINSISFDLEKIEIAKGPQNALYGRNSFGGTINAISKKPQNRRELWFNTRLGSYDEQQIEAGINQPLTNAINARLALYLHKKGGYFSNLLSKKPEIGSENTKALRLSFGISPDSDRQITTSLTHIHDHDGQPKGFLVPANCGERTTDGQNRLFCGTLPKSPESGTYAANDVGTEQQMGYNRDHTRLMIEWKETLSDNTIWTTLVGGSIEQSTFIRDDDYSAINASRAGIDTDRFDMQMDTRLNLGTKTSATKALLGFSAYHFYNNTNRLDQFYILGQTSPGGAKTTHITDTLGIYGSIAHEWKNGLTITGDSRLQWEQKDIASDRLAITTGNPISMKDSWTAFTPKLTASWQAREKDKAPLFYTSITRGYKTGGFNDRANIFDSERTYAPETNTTIEAGAKNIALAKGLTADIGAFYIDWRDQQVIAYSTAGSTQNFFINNAAQTTVKGIEASIKWTPVKNLDFNLGYTYSDARYDSYKDPDLANVEGFAPDGDVSGNRLPRYSPHQISITSNYRIASAFPDSDMVFSGQLTHESSQYTDNSSTSKTGARTLLNLQAGIESKNGYIGLWVDNALDERDPNVGIPWFNAAQSFRREWLVTPQDGTRAGIRIKLNW